MAKWRALVEQPTITAETVVGNWKENKNEILSAINDLEKKISSEDFEAAGKDLSDILELGVGPIISD